MINNFYPFLNYEKYLGRFSFIDFNFKIESICRLTNHSKPYLGTISEIFSTIFQIF